MRTPIGAGPLVFANITVVLALLAQWVNALVTDDLGFRGHVIGLDFVNTWLGAKLAWTGDVGALFDFPAYNVLLQNRFGAGFPAHMWSYPPHLLPLIEPLGAFDYVTAYMLWCAATLAVFLWGARAVGFRGADLLLLATSPAIAMNIVVGQTGALAAGLLMGSLGYLGRRAVPAGLAAGFLTVKPQFGLLLPVVMLLRRRFKIIFVAMLTTSLLVALSILLLGWEPWRGFLNITMPAMRDVMMAGDLPAARVMRPNWASSLQLLDVPTEVAFAVQLAISLLLVGFSLFALWPGAGAAATGSGTSQRADPANLALLLMASVLMTPYIHNYDLVIVAPVILWAWRQPAILGASATESALGRRGRRLLLILAWIMPWVMIPLHQNRIILAPVILTWITILVFRAILRDRAPGPVTGNLAGGSPAAVGE